ncbi:Wadjet anti-phage system protein JetA family protein [Vogesella indigofera]|uniref:Wadjet anti-phage system protein JetA family protein n=1 Tax=Vogesella indigofera TaxID=45465 RepID=UPI0035B4BFB8
MTGLFERLPEGLFAPLSSPNKSVYWDLLLRMHDLFFGPDAMPPEGDGFLQRSITLEIERFITDTDWTQEGEDEQNTPLNVRANIIYRRLVSSGWLREDRIGVKNYVSMPTTVQKFLEILRQFAEEGPQIIAGKVQLIHNQLEQVLADPARQASGFHEAANQARQLINTLSATTMRVREAIDLLSAQETTAAFVRTFFDNYIGQLYIRDYHELRTENHPLRNRGRIISIALTLRDDLAKRETMVSYYKTTFRCPSMEEAEERFERDVGRFLMFKDIDRHLDRLNASVDQATARAMAYLHYKVRTQDKLDRLLSVSIDRLKDTTGDEVTAMGILSGHLLAETRLPPIQKRSGPMSRSAISKPRMTIEQIAQVRLKKLMKLHREVSPANVTAYLEKCFGPNFKVSSDDMQIGGIHDFCVFVQVMRLALLSRKHTGLGRKTHPMLHALKDYRFDFIEGEVTDSEYLCVPKFQVTRRIAGVNYAS